MSLDSTECKKLSVALIRADLAKKNARKILRSSGVAQDTKEAERILLDAVEELHSVLWSLYNRREP